MVTTGCCHTDAAIPSITYAIPVRVRGPATVNVLAVWAHHGKTFYASAMQGPAQLAVHRYRRFLQGPSVVIGDSTITCDGIDRERRTTMPIWSASWKRSAW